MHRVIAIFVLLFSPLLTASPQWLQYRTSGQMRQGVTGDNSKFHRPVKDVSIDTPKLNSESPVYFQWSTPMDKAGFRYGVFDKKNKYGLCNILYFDCNGNRRLDDDPKIEGLQINEYEVEFMKIPVVFDSADGPITYHLNLRFYSYDEDSTYIYAYAGCWYEGQVEVGGQKQRCLLLDRNVNGSFNDKSEDFDSDLIRIVADSSQVEAAVGNYLEYKDALYRVDAAQDGACIELTAAPDVAYGEIQLSKEITEFSAGGLNGIYTRQVTDGRIKLPEGNYRIRDWSIKRKDDKGIEWKLEGSYPDRNERFTVSKDTPAVLNTIGEPVFANLSANENEGSYYINQSLQGQSGERIYIYRDGRQAPAPKVSIRNKTGEYDRTFSLEYG